MQPIKQILILEDNDERIAGFHQVTAPDTVPFCLWIAAHHSSSFVDALGKTISVGGDCDTNAAIVGGIVALSADRGSIPTEWLEAREPTHI